MTEPRLGGAASSLDAMEQSREAQARSELAETRVAPWLARATVAGFVAVVAGVPAVQVVALVASAERGGARALSACDLRASMASPPTGGTSNPWQRVRAANRRLLGQLAACEDALEAASPVREWLRPWVQYVMTAIGRAGSEQVHVAPGGWLFFRPDVAHVAGPDLLDAAARGPRIVRETDTPRARDPIPAIVAFRDALARRGLALVVVPTPVKPTVHPERVAGGEAPAGPLHNRGFDRLLSALGAAGVDVVDVAPALVELAREAPVYLATDTHWRPEAVRAAARTVARHIEALGVLAPRAEAAFVERIAAVEQHGDSVALLGLPPWQALFPRERVVIRRVSRADGAPWRPDPHAETLVLGDSFTNIYSLGAMGWGEAAGFAEQLALALGRPVDRIVQNADGAHATRELLARELAAGRDRLAGKRVVVWQFAARELSQGDWRVVPLPEPAARAPGFIVPPAGVSWVATGRIAAMSRVPRPGTVPYRDHIAALHLADLRVPEAGIDHGEAMVYVLTMRDNAWTAAGAYNVGDTIRLRLRPWADVAAVYEGISRSELDAESLLSVEPCWGEPMGNGR
jgi:alginate O-acetyltransferase complex protein AlgJ